MGSSTVSPLSRLITFLWEDKKDIIVLFIYSVVSSILGLSIPLAAQALVNVIASGLFLQPLLVLTSLVFLGLLVASTVRLMEVSLVEILQQRVFARVALRLATQLPKLHFSAFNPSYPPEMMNRFFDTVTVQKALGKLLLVVPAALLQILFSLVFMAFYSPFLLGYDLLVVLGFFALTLLGHRAVRTSIDESVCKYQTAHWLQEQARCLLNLKMNAGSNFALKQADVRVSTYLKARKGHFKIVFGQRIANALFYALSNAGILALGGWLVLQQQLTLGQLIAAELMMILLLQALDKLVEQLESFYDLQSAMDKLGVLFDLKPENAGQHPFIEPSQGGVQLEMRHLYFNYQNGQKLLKDLSLMVPANAKVSIVGASGSGKTTLAYLASGLLEPEFGNIMVQGVDLRDLEPASLRDRVSLVSGSQDLLEATLEDNIKMGRQQCSREDMLWALDMVDLTPHLAKLEQGLRTVVSSEGKNLSEGLRQRVILARALIERPKLLILDEAFSGMDERSKLLILERLMLPEAPWTLLHFTHDVDVLARSQQVWVLSEGALVEQGEPWALAYQKGNAFCRLFPKLSELMRRLPPEVVLAPVN
jgi:ABC-type bacteriocin/lantibiotic exporter with double-glycine peptidase domain